MIAGDVLPSHAQSQDLREQRCSMILMLLCILVQIVIEIQRQCADGYESLEAGLEGLAMDFSSKKDAFMNTKWKSHVCNTPSIRAGFPQQAVTGVSF